MKRNVQFLLVGIIIGAVFFGGAVAYAAGILAQPKTATVIIDGEVVDIKGYLIEGNHYFQLRDLDSALIPGGKDFSIVWDNAQKHILIDTSRGYDPNEALPTVTPTPTPTPAPEAMSIDENAVDGWMSSSGHSANMLASKFTHIGVGIVNTPSVGCFYVVHFVGL